MVNGPPHPTISLREVRGVVFDLDDTLHPEQSYAFSGFAAVAAWLRSRFECRFDPLPRMREIFLTGDRRRVFDQVLADLGCPTAPDLVPEMIRRYREHVPGIELFPDAQATLQSWRGRFRLGLISDGPLHMQQRKVESLGLNSRLDSIILTDRWGAAYWKPHCRAFEHLEEQFGLLGRSLVYIADNCAKDFVAPRALGWQTVCVHRPGGLYCHLPAPPGGLPEHQVQSLTELDLRPEA